MTAPEHGGGVHTGGDITVKDAHDGHALPGPGAPAPPPFGRVVADAERIARRLHDAYRTVGRAWRSSALEAWDDLTDEQRSIQVAAVSALLATGVLQAGQRITLDDGGDDA